MLGIGLRIGGGSLPPARTFWLINDGASGTITIEKTGNYKIIGISRGADGEFDGNGETNAGGGGGGCAAGEIQLSTGDSLTYDLTGGAVTVTLVETQIDVRAAVGTAGGTVATNALLEQSSLSGGDGNPGLADFPGGGGGASSDLFPGENGFEDQGGDGGGGYAGRGGDPGNEFGVGTGQPGGNYGGGGGGGYSGSGGAGGPAVLVIQLL
jgi:hypothetical protein